MSDEHIRKILEEMRKEEKRMQRREVILESVKVMAAWIALFAICFTLSVIGG